MISLSQIERKHELPAGWRFVLELKKDIQGKTRNHLGFPR
jgi:hypothetical protein